ncbi:MAG: sugar-binding domain-containing protein [Oscillospiraceae bacterium]
MSYISMRDEKEKRLFLEKIAKMYYINEMKQNEIADQFSIGRSSVARFLKEANELGIVEIHVNSIFDSERYNDLEHDILSKYKIKDCLVVNREKGKIANSVIAQYLDGVIPYKGVLGVGGGETMFELGKHIWNLDSRHELSVVQLCGSLGQTPETSVTKNWADALSAKGVYMPAPLLAQSKESREIFMDDPSINRAFEKIKNLSAIILSIGSSGKNHKNKYLSMFDNIDSEGVYERSIGDIMFRFFDEYGNFPFEELNSRIIGATVEDYLSTPLKIVVAYGERKVQALTTALDHDFIDVLITDVDTAQGILK